MQTRKRSAENGRRQGETAHTPLQYGTYRTAKRPVRHCKTARMAVQDMGFGSLKKRIFEPFGKEIGAQGHRCCSKKQPQREAINCRPACYGNRCENGPFAFGKGHGAEKAGHEGFVVMTFQRISHFPKASTARYGHPLATATSPQRPANRNTRATARHTKPAPPGRHCHSETTPRGMRRAAPRPAGRHGAGRDPDGGRQP